MSSFKKTHQHLNHLPAAWKPAEEALWTTCKRNWALIIQSTFVFTDRRHGPHSIGFLQVTSLTFGWKVGPAIQFHYWLASLKTHVLAVDIIAHVYQRSKILYQQLWHTAGSLSGPGHQGGQTFCLIVSSLFQICCYLHIFWSHFIYFFHLQFIAVLIY